MIPIKQILSVAIPFAAGCAAVLGYTHITRTDPVAPPRAVVSQAQDVQQPLRQAVPEVSTPAAVVQAAPPAELTLSEKLAKWIHETDDENAETRASAITALGTGPRPIVISTLRKVMEHGQTVPDRQLALQSLRKVALDQGDDDGAIRNAVRQVIYHASEQAMIGSARQVLNELESVPAS